MTEAAPSRPPLGAVFVLSLVICGAIGLWGVLAPDALAGAANALTGFALTTLDWFFLLLCTGFVVLGAALALGPYGRIKLGADDDEPEFSTLSWIAMLFAGGMGAGPGSGASAARPRRALISAMSAVRRCSSARR